MSTASDFTRAAMLLPKFYFASCKISFLIFRIESRNLFSFEKELQSVSVKHDISN